MRGVTSPNPKLMAFYEKEIAPKIPDKLQEFDKILNENGFPKRSYYLFGSFSRGTPTLRSDIDIAVIVDSVEGISSANFYDLLGDRGMLDRIKGARIELTLFDKETFAPFIQENENIKEIQLAKSRGNPEVLE